MGAIQTRQSDGIGEMLDSLISAEGSATHRYVCASALFSGPEATRNLADAAHYLCVLHGRHPGVIDFAAGKAAHPAAQEWLIEAADGFGHERGYLTRVTVAAGPLPSTPGHSHCEVAVMGQRHALEMIAQSDRTGCALGAAVALVMDWVAIRPILDHAAERLGLDVPPLRLPDDRETRTVALAAADALAVERAMAFGAQQILSQHRGLWDMLEARQRARIGL